MEKLGDGGVQKRGMKSITAHHKPEQLFIFYNDEQKYCKCKTVILY